MDDPAKILPQVRGCLTAWGIQAQQIELVSQSGNIVYKLVCSDGRAFAMRVHRPGYQTLAELNAQHSWTTALVNAGFAIPASLATLTGTFFELVQLSCSDRYVELVEWLQGATLFDLTADDQNPALLQASVADLGATLARLHNHAEHWAAPPGFARPRLDIDGFFGPAPHWGRYWEAPLMQPAQRQLLDQTRPRIIEQLQSLGEAPGVFGIMHADLHHDNVFITAQGTYLIDFDESGFGWYLYDIAAALQEYEERDDFAQLTALLVQGYRQYRELSQAELDLLPLFLHIRSRATIGWASARPELDNADRIVALIERTCAQAGQLLPG